MEDPWAAGPSWSTPSKPDRSASPSPSGLLTTNVDIEKSPRFDISDSDPWGAPSSSSSLPRKLPGEDDRPDVRRNEQDDGGGWGNEQGAGWGGPSIVKPPEPTSPNSLREPMDHEVPSWPTTQPASDSDMYVPSEPSVTLPRAPSPSSLAQDSLPTFELPPPPDPLPTFDMPPVEVDPEELLAAALSQSRTATPIPRSGSFGAAENGFGGFSAGVVGDASDPWGSGAGGFADVSWERQDSGSDNEETEQTTRPGQTAGENDGWDWSSRLSPMAPPVGQSSASKDETDWEEAQRRIQVRQDRAVSTQIHYMVWNAYPPCSRKRRLHRWSRRGKM